MNIKVTNCCTAGCSHCMEDSTKAGTHMTFETFQKALDLTAQLEGTAWSLGALPQILVSGGECTEHPDIVMFLKEIQRRGWIPTVLTNGLWLERDPELRAQILALPMPLTFQVTHNARFYPHAPPTVPVDDPRFLLGIRTELAPILQLGRGKRWKGDASQRRAPTSFNLRSLTRSTRSLVDTLTILRLRNMVSGMHSCAPSISSDGTFTIGETSNCYPIGTVDSTPAELTQAILRMADCNRCGLETNLTQEQKIAIGIARVHLQ